MRIKTILLLTAASVALTVAGDSPQYDLPGNPDMAIVKSYCGREFNDSDEPADPLIHAMSRLSSRPLPKPMLDPTPAYVWKFTHSKEDQTSLVLERSWFDPMPGTTRVQLTLLRDDGAMLATATFQMGGRIYLSKARLRPLLGSEFPILEANASSWFGGREQQFYAFVEDRFDTIRVADKNGRACRNHYFHGSDISGPLPPDQSEEKWEADLCHGNRVEALRALTWLGGIHDVAGAAQPPKPGVATAAKVRTLPAVASRLRQLAKNGLTWEREMAELALNPKDDQ
jgi:hypothetical protein